MSGSDFSRISARYDQTALVQKAASEALFEMLAIGPAEDALDVGCAAGALTARIREMTSGRVTGVDPAKGMVEKAKAAHEGKNIEFLQAGAAQMSFGSEFDLIFCNSTLQWLKDDQPSLAACLKALRPGGRMGVQAPATSGFCAQFVEVTRQVSAHPATAGTFARFQSPWLLREDAEGYSAIFRQAGFIVKSSQLVRTTTVNTADEAMGIFESGAAAGFLNPACYPVPITEEYVSGFRAIAMDHFRRLADAAGGRFELEFFRIYLLAQKPGLA